MNTALNENKEARYYLCCPKCKRVMSAWFTYCGGISGPCQVRREEGVWVHENATAQSDTYGGSDRRFAVSLAGAQPFQREQG